MKIEDCLVFLFCIVPFPLLGDNRNESDLHRLDVEAARVSSNLVVRLTELQEDAPRTGDTISIEDVLKPFDEMTDDGTPFRPMSLEAALLAYAERGDAERRDLLLFALTGLVERAEAVQQEVFRAFASVWIGDPVMDEGMENARNKRMADGVDEIAPLVASFALEKRLDDGVRRESSAFLAQLVLEDPTSDDMFISAARILQERLSESPVENQDRQQPEFKWDVPIQPKTNRAIRVRASARTYAVCEAGLSDSVSSQDVYIPRRGRPIPISRIGSTWYAVSCGFRFLAETQSDDGSWNENPALTSLATLAFISNRSDDVFEKNYLPVLEKSLVWLEKQVDSEDSQFRVPGIENESVATVLATGLAAGHGFALSGTAHAIQGILSNRVLRLSIPKTSLPTRDFPEPLTDRPVVSPTTEFLRFSEKRIDEWTPAERHSAITNLVAMQRRMSFDGSPDPSRHWGFWCDRSVNDDTAVVEAVLRKTKSTGLPLEAKSIFDDVIAQSAVALFMIEVLGDSQTRFPKEYSECISVISEWAVSRSDIAKGNVIQESLPSVSGQ